MYKSRSYDKESYKQQQQELAKNMQNIIENYAKTYNETPEQLAELAAFKSRFYKYSYKNTVLIVSQNPHATFVGSFERFKKIGEDLTKNLPQEIGYVGVKKGEKGMKIYVPVVTQLALVNEEKNEWVQVLKLSKAEQELVKAGVIKSKESLSFKVGTVFDISQTNIPPEVYPEIMSMGYNSSEHKIVYDGLKKCIENKYKCPVKLGIDNTIAIRGLCYTNDIVLNYRMKDTQLLSTLCHEFGHYLMHNGENAGDKPINRELIELEADIYGIMLETHFGITPTDVRKGHLAENYRACIANIADDSEKAKLIEQAFTKASKAFADSIGNIEESISEEKSAQQAAAPQAYNMSDYEMAEEAVEL